MASDERVATALAAWAERDAHAAITEEDTRAIASTEGARALVVERLLDAAGRDALSACSVLGRLMAQAGASPSLAARTLDGLAATSPCDDAWLGTARASLAEGYAAASREAAAAKRADTWRYPRCVVRLDSDTVAVGAGFPDDDPDTLAEWANEVARGLVKAGVRRAIIDGDLAPRAALEEALELAGISVARGDRPRSWLPWKR